MFKDKNENMFKDKNENMFKDKNENSTCKFNLAML
jgi:hypothetical protein